jgi:hypothetical protein
MTRPILCVAQVFSDGRRGPSGDARDQREQFRPLAALSANRRSDPETALGLAGHLLSIQPS